MDGLDHISRVFAEAATLSRGDVDIVEELAVLPLSPGVTVILGTQPGPHLAPLEGKAASVSVPAWDELEVAALSERLGTWQAEEKAGVAPGKAEWAQALLVRSEGNPLYATYLCRGLEAELTAQHVTDPLGWLREAPAFEGQISNYYEFLLRGTDDFGAAVAELLGVIDFSVTRSDLEEIFGQIFPLMQQRLAGVLARLQPVLLQTSAQGGFRIYHESFRRFIVERLQQQGGSVQVALAPIVAWLERRGLFVDAKTYRFLLPCLRRAGQKTELLARVQHDFVSRSIEAGQPRRAIDENLSIAALVATEVGDWAALARVAHLQHAVVEFELARDIIPYGQAYAALFGASALAERLLFDGRPTLPRPEGLLLCEICDDLGQTAPWAEYLALVEQKRNVTPEPYGETKHIAEFHGNLRLEGAEAFVIGLAKWLRRYAQRRESSRQPNGLPARTGLVEDAPLSNPRNYLRKFARLGGVQVLEALRAHLEESAGRKPQLRLPDEMAGLVDVEIGIAYKNMGDADAACIAAERAATRQITPELAAECLALGASSQVLARFCPDLDQLVGELNAGTGAREEKVSRWVAGTRIAAATDPAALQRAASTLKDESWYWHWLRFAAAIAGTETMAVADPAQAQEDAVTALEWLARDTAPFKGTPRACDLYTIRGLTSATMARALPLLSDVAAWERAITALAAICDGTTTYLDLAAGGPLTPQVLLDILFPYVSRPIIGERVREAMEKHIQDSRDKALPYSIHAENEMLMARLLTGSGRVDEARASWAQSAVYLAAYGYHKDISLYDLTESAPALAECNLARAREALAKAQPLTELLWRHTDGRDTRRISNSWFEALCLVDPTGAADVLGRSMRMDGGNYGWKIEEAVGDVLKIARDTGNPLTLAFLEATLPISADDHSRAQDVHGAIKRRLAVIERLLQEEPRWGRLFFLSFTAQAQGDPHVHHESAMHQVEEFAACHGFSKPELHPSIGPCARRENAPYSPPRTESSWRGRPLHPFLAAGPLSEPPFPAASTPLQMLSALRELCDGELRSYGGSTSWAAFINAFGFRLLELLEAGQEGEALRLLRYFARHCRFEISATPLFELAQGMERHGYGRAAATAYGLAYARSHSRGGWMHMGGKDHEDWLAQGAALDGEAVWRTVGEEVTALLQRGYYGGVARNLIEFCARQLPGEVAFDAWDAAFKVLCHRLPSASTLSSFASYKPQEVPTWSLDQALAFMLVARVGHPEFGRRETAVTGLCALIACKPDDLAQPLRRFLSADLSNTTALLILQSLHQAEAAPFPLTRVLRDELDALLRCDHFGLRLVAQQLLARIGVPLPAGPRLAATRIIAAPLSRRTLSSLALDWGARATNVSVLWPDFPPLVGSRFAQIWDSSPEHKRRAEYLHESARNRGQRSVPETPFFFWENELFEIAFHEVLDGLGMHLWKQGEWSPQIESLLLRRVVPPLRLHVACWLSRIPRPALPLPSERSEGVAVPAPLQNAGEFTGWYRVGLEETEIICRERDKEYPDVLHPLTSTVGVEILPPSRSAFPLTSWCGPDELPLGIGQPLDHWEDAGEDDDSGIGTGFAGPVTGFAFLKSPLGSRSLLSLHPWLSHACDLRFGSWPDPLQLVDAAGQKAVVYRCWSVRPLGPDVDESTPRLSGCELLVRADVLLRATRSGLRGGSLTAVEATRIQSHP